jgi:hypothetical protein
MMSDFISDINSLSPMIQDEEEASPSAVKERG